MRNTTKLFMLMALGLMLMFNACQKDEVDFQSLRELSLEPADDIRFEKLKLSDQALSKTMGDNTLRNDFHKFIRAKVELTQNSEELSFQEIFLAKPVQLSGVPSDFMKRFKQAFVDNIIEESKDFQNFNSHEEVRAYYDVNLEQDKIFDKGGNIRLKDDYIIYFPYSEEFGLNETEYSTTFDPLTNSDRNVGKVYDYKGDVIDEVLIDDAYAFRNPTYISMIDDGLSFDEASAMNKGGKFEGKVLDDCFGIYDIYNPYEQIEGDLTCGGGGNVLPDTGTDQCGNKEIRVGGGRWTLLNNGYGLFEGAIEFGYAFSNEVSEVNIPGGSAQNTVTIDVSAQYWSYTKIKRSKVKDMQKNIHDSVNMGWFAGNFCEDDPDRMLYLFEYDARSGYEDQVSSIVSSVGGLFPDDSNLHDALQNISAVVTTVIPQSKNAEEFYGRLRSSSTYQNHDVPSSATVPTNIKGYRLYGNNDVNVYFVYD